MMKASIYIYILLIFFVSTECYGASENSHSSDNLQEGRNAQPYLKENRRKYIAETLQALHETGLQTLLNTFQYINVVDRNSCQSNLSTLRLECMLGSAAENCKSLRSSSARSNCQYYSDVIIVNKLSEKQFISKSERYQMARNNSDGDINEASNRRLIQKYARIVTQFVLSEHSSCENDDFYCLAGGLDQFCLDYTNKESLSWQYCTSAILWFIGTSKSK